MLLQLLTSVSNPASRLLKIPQILPFAFINAISHPQYPRENNNKRQQQETTKNQNKQTTNDQPTTKPKTPTKQKLKQKNCQTDQEKQDLCEPSKDKSTMLPMLLYP